MADSVDEGKRLRNESWSGRESSMSWRIELRMVQENWGGEDTGWRWSGRLRRGRVCAEEWDKENRGLWGRV